MFVAGSLVTRLEFVREQIETLRKPFDAPMDVKAA